jgi:hypothetical protein
MSDNMVLKTIRELSESGPPEMAAIIGIPLPGGNSTISAQQAVDPLGEGLRSLLGHQATSNPFKTAGELLESLEHIERHFRERRIKPSTEGR